LKNWDAKYKYLEKHQNGKCPVCSKPLIYQLVSKLDLHHRNPDKKWRRKKRPLFCDSILNLVLIHKSCHSVRGRFMQITDFNADRWERFLEMHPKCAEFVNMEL